MKRWTFRILLCLFFGVVTTVGVAWGLVFINVEQGSVRARNDDKGNDRYGSFIVSSRGFRHWGDHTITILPAEILIRHTPGLNVSRRLLSPYITEDRYAKVLPEWSLFREPSLIDAIYDEHWYGGRMVAYVEHASGWPCISLRSRHLWVMEREPFQIMHIPTEFLGVPITVGETYRKSLPLRPILPGFLFNTLFYGIIWFGIFFGPGAVRRTIRRRRGRCVKCGYDLRGDFDSGCSECGWGRS